VGDTTLRRGVDYTVSYSNNINAGKAKILITGYGGYTGTIQKTFTIQPADNVDSNLTVALAWGASSAAYSQGGATPDLAVRVGSRSLVKGRDYTVTFKNNKKLAASNNAKAPTAVIKGKGNYRFQKTLKFTIVEKSLSDSDMTITAADKVIGGKGSLLSTPVVKDAKGRKLKVNRDYTIEGYYLNGEKFDGSNSDAVKAGDTITVKVRGVGNYTGTITTTYHFATNDIAKSTNVAVQPQTYSGGTVVFTEDMIQSGALRVTDKTSGKSLVYGTDYIITGYKNNAKKGTATMTIHGIGEAYGGTRDVKFKIVK
jgi:hypothetical protein